MKRILFLLILVSSLFMGCSKKEAEPEVQESEKGSTAVKAEIIGKKTLYETLTGNGNVRVESSLDVYSVVSGRLVKNEISLGKKVNKGDLIAIIDPSITGGKYALHEVTAPISGTILSNPLQTGSIISSDTKLCIIGDLSHLQIEAYIPERFYGQMKKGLNAELFVEAYPGRSFKAKVQSISPVIDESSRCGQIVLTLEENYPEIVAGMFANMKLYLKAYEDVISIPANCISNRSDQSFVYTVDQNNDAKLTKIQTGKTIENRIIVSSGLSENDTVITEGFETLVEGSPVNIISKQN